MLDEGTDAPTVTLPAIVDGAPRDVDLSDYVGGGILILVFYPGDFNPSCAEDSCDLTELDPFTMQQDVDIFAVSTDSIFSHRAFAEEYSLSIPLLSDTHGEALNAYEVGYEDSDQLLAKRAVFVIDQRGVIQYAWETSDLEERPAVDEVREAVSEIGGDSTALGRYRVGHAHYMEGRRAFTSAMSSYEDRDWLISQGDFERAMEEFQESADHFQSAVRFAESGPLREGFERAQEKATALWQAAEWLADSANAYASGNGKTADDYRQDAETPLKNARDIGEPPDPDDIDLDAAAAAEAAEEGDDSGDLEAPTDPGEDEDTSEPGGEAKAEPDDEDIDAAVQELEAEDGEVAAPTDGDEQDAGAAETAAGAATAESDGEAVEEPDEEEIDAIAEELEKQNRKAQEQAETTDEADDESSPTDGAVPDRPPGRDDHQHADDHQHDSTDESPAESTPTNQDEPTAESTPAEPGESSREAQPDVGAEGVGEAGPPSTGQSPDQSPAERASSQGRSSSSGDQQHSSAAEGAAGQPPERAENGPTSGAPGAGPRAKSVENVPTAQEATEAEAGVDGDQQPGGQDDAARGPGGETTDRTPDSDSRDDDVAAGDGGEDEGADAGEEDDSDGGGEVDLDLTDPNE